VVAAAAAAAAAAVVVVVVVVAMVLMKQHQGLRTSTLTKQVVVGGTGTPRPLYRRGPKSK